MHAPRIQSSLKNNADRRIFHKADFSRSQSTENEKLLCEIDFAFLQNYSLDFADHSDMWQGSYGTLEKGGYCWGCVWEMDAADFEALNVFVTIF